MSATVISIKFLGVFFMLWSCEQLKCGLRWCALIWISSCCTAQMGHTYTHIWHSTTAGWLASYRYLAALSRRSSCRSYFRYAWRVVKGKSQRHVL